MADAEIIKPDPIVRVDAQVGLEEVAAIKVAEIERTLILRAEDARAALKKAEEAKGELAKKFEKAVLDDTREEYPEIDKIEDMLKKLFKNQFQVSIRRQGDKVGLEITAHGSVTWKGQKSHDLQKEMEAKDKEIETQENELVEVKKGLCLLPHVERTAKAAVAKQRLASTKEGQQVLKSIEKIELPGLPAPKK